MKIILLSGAVYSIPSMHFLQSNKMLETVVSLGKPNKHNLQVEHAAALLNLPYKRFLKADLLTTFKDWLTEAAPDLVLIYGCAYKIPPDLFNIPRLGIYNVHFSLLPAYRGKAPVFWQLKNGESTGGITIHRLAAEFDNGPILMQQEIPLFPGENYGLYSGRLSAASVELVAKAIEKLKGCDSALWPQDETMISYAPAPVANDLMINWETQSAKEIENLVNATNPDFEGAITSLRGQPFRILEVNPAQFDNAAEFVPGTIVHSDINHGLFVACKNAQFLRINIGGLTEGIFSGLKLAGIGIAAGERFENAGALVSFKVAP